MKGVQAACHKCGAAVAVYAPLQVVEQLSARYTAALREIDSLKAQLDDSELQENLQNNPLNNLDLNNTDKLATAAQHQPLANWFTKQNVKAEFNYSAVDMSGFYDEAAQKIGQNYALLADLMRKLSWSYHKNVLNLNLDLKKYNQKQQQKINHICREFYSHTLFSVYNYKKQDKILFLKLQIATPIRQFFMGGWLEWFALNSVLQTVQAKNVRFSVARSVKIHFQNQDLHELDVVLYTSNGVPIVIECKTGEYRKDLDKYLNLRKRLNIPANNFILLVLDIDDAQAKSLSSMYDLTFVTLNTLQAHIEKVV
ncbi:MAG: DUF1887 family CARF protein [Alysiella sp.]|uniref:Card1-like endonuclease domain-containing protein n=1 Tax=Alysiella sp. TaxID=1872483 RepID=UPI0026DAD596|nr:DUF1887 family CARF protein [Alysiella sp.]MDO4433628.1 DUF1887 family CARF protein [Alysiella sp.]